MASKRTIFIIDDDQKVLNLLEATLRLKDFEVLKMDDPRGALSYLKENVPDLILAGVNLPGASGYDFFHRVRETTRAAYTPFILLGGADDDPVQAARALRMGAEEFLRKPFSIDELLVRVEKVFEKVDRARTAQPSTDLEGRLEHVRLFDLLVFLGQLRSGGRLTLSLTADPVEGFLVLQEGHVRHAVFGLLKGRAALLQLLPRSRGAFAFVATTATSVPVITVPGDTPPILEEARLLQEGGRLRRVDVTNKDACRLFDALIGDQPPEEPMPLDDGVILLTERVKGADETETIEMPSLRSEEIRVADVVSDPEAASSASVEMSIDENPPTTVDEGDADGEEEDAPEAPDAPAADASHEVVQELGSDGDELVMEMPSAGGELEDEPPPPDVLADESLVIEGEEAHVTRSTVLVPADSLFADEDSWDLSGEGSGLEGEDMATSSIIISARPADQEVFSYEDEDEDDLRTSQDAEESAVALVDSGPGPVERLFTLVADNLVGEEAGLGVEDVLIATRSGRPLAATVDDLKRREHLAAFAAQAIQFAPERELGTYAELSASDLHLVVVALPYRRLLACTFGAPPDATRLMERVNELVDESD